MDDRAAGSMLGNNQAIKQPHQVENCTNKSAVDPAAWREPSKLVPEFVSPAWFRVPRHASVTAPSLERKGRLRRSKGRPTEGMNGLQGRAVHGVSPSAG